ncbi:prepilin-type N-terminal cleavage/methylation domain-containing protein [Rhodanobacter denitrificans]|uniref:prepilin-type N-terminal cleavage/methylation domain-containing protein n=1 Tax=Rhodanobacter denitrificans TaxID=666685 RepID=UPI000260D98E|nr:prepilin-type N-terminal cleavage/methylation domain-containing protein [Rhodanobacter denitrificans]EIM00861.1 General secretion pathway protein J [Rhodanobacter denitrificans]UJM90710.1 prepilin-type N-terminal cleavage/methylation domain-containing protein [Rhodanobacter denitrificans]
MRRTTGFTLLEVLSSLALLALLLIGVYSGVSTAARSVRSGTMAIERIDQIRSAQQFLRRELAQSMALPIGRTVAGENIYFQGSAHEMHYAAPLPAYLGKLGPQVQSLQLVDDGHGDSRLIWSLALLSPDGRPPRTLGDPQVLLDHIHGGSFAYRGTDAQGHTVPWSAIWADGQLLPLLVRIDLQLQGAYGWPLLQAPLRINSGNRGAVSRIDSFESGAVSGSFPQGVRARRQQRAGGSR